MSFAAKSLQRCGGWRRYQEGYKFFEPSLSFDQITELVYYNWFGGPNTPLARKLLQP